MERKGFSFMAFAAGSESKEIEVKRLIGIAAAKVLAVNPTRKERNDLLGQDYTDEEIKYVGEATVKDKDNQNVNVPQIRIDILMKTDPEIACNNGLEEIFTVSYFINKAANYSFKDGVTKMQVIDKYGRTAWVTPEQAKNKVVPEYIIKNGPRAGQTFKAAICPDYRPAYIGEEDLVKFMIALINIPRPDVWNEEQKAYVMKTDAKELAKSEACLDHIKAYFEGDVSEIKKILKFQPNNRVKLLLGVRTAQNGSLYQAVYTRMPLKLGVTSYKVWEDAIKDDKTAGRHPNIEYRVANLAEFKAQATDYSEKEAPKEDDPFASPEGIGGTPSESAAEPIPIDTDPFSM